MGNCLSATVRVFIVNSENRKNGAQPAHLRFNQCPLFPYENKHKFYKIMMRCSVLINITQTRVAWEEGLSAEELLHRIGLCCIFLIDNEWPSPLWAVSPLASLNNRPQSVNENHLSFLSFFGSQCL